MKKVTTYLVQKNKLLANKSANSLNHHIIPISVFIIIYKILSQLRAVDSLPLLYNYHNRDVVQKSFPYVTTPLGVSGDLNHHIDPLLEFLLCTHSLG